MALKARPGQTVKLKYPLNQTDIVSFTVDWSDWLGSDTISSSAWAVETGLTTTGESNTTTTATALVNAATTNGRIKVENQITTAGGQKRTVALEATVVDLIS